MHLDLHCHSTCSDGSLAPEIVAERAREAGLRLFCLADHDTCDGYLSTVEVLGAERALRGVELSCYEDGRPVHLLIYDVGRDDRWVAVEDLLARMKRARRGRLRTIAARLAALGVTVDAEAILANAGGRAVGRPDLARAMVRGGVVSSMTEAFQRYLGDAGPVYEPVERLDVGAALEIGRAAGARMALAHPHLLGDRAPTMARRYRDAGLEGFEAYYGPYSAAQRRDWTRVAAELDLVVTAGSDYHGETLPQVKKVGVELPEPHASRVLGWLEIERTAG